MVDLCPKCGKNRDLVGYRHNCDERRDRLPVPPPRLVIDEAPARPVRIEGKVRLAKARAAAAGVPGYMAKLGIRNVDKRRAYMRELMRRKRGKGG